MPSSCFDKLISKIHKNLSKLKDNEDSKTAKKYANKIEKVGNQGSDIDIVAFSLLTGFYIYKLNNDYTLDKIYKSIDYNNNPTNVYIIQNDKKDHIEAIIPKDENLYNNIKNYKNVCEDLNNKLIIQYETMQKINEKIINKSAIDNNSKNIKHKNQEDIENDNNDKNNEKQEKI